MKKRFITIIIAILVIVAGVLLWQSHKNKSKVQWRTFNTLKTTITESITATGTINPVVQVNVGTEVSGRIEKIYKDFNDHVKKGELLAKLDTQTLEMNLEEAKIELRKTRLTADENLIDLNSAKELRAKDMISQHDLQKAQYTYDLSLENIRKAEFIVQRAQTNLENAYIHSPIDGVIISRAVDEGQTVAASLNAPTLFIIANNLDEMQIEAQIDEADIGKLKTNLFTRFTVDAFDEMTFTGRVRQIRLNPITEQNVVTYKVIITINNPDKILMPGMTANVEIVINQKQNILAIQERALQFRPTKEIWDSFGLKWDESLVASRTRTRNTSTQTTPTVQNESKPDSLQAKTGQRHGQGQGQGRGMRQQIESSTEKVSTAMIWVLDNNIPKQIQVETGISNGTFIEMIKGLEEGQSVITGVNYISATVGTGSAFTPTGPGRF